MICIWNKKEKRKRNSELHSPFHQMPFYFLQHEIIWDELRVSHTIRNWKNFKTVFLIWQFILWDIVFQICNGNKNQNKSMKSLRVNKCNMLIMLCRKDIVCNYWIPNPLSSGMNKSYFICYNFFIDSRNHKYLKQLKSFQVTNRKIFFGYSYFVSECKSGCI